jgi:hypothetical protein
MRTRELIRWLKRGRYSHISCADFLRADPNAGAEPDPRPVREVIGDPEWHDKWIAIYDEVIARISKHGK